MEIPIIAIHGAGKVNDFKGSRKLNVNKSCGVKVNPVCTRSQALEMWQATAEVETKYDTSVITDMNTSQFSKQELLHSAEKELENLKKKEEEIAIKRARLKIEIKRLE